MQSIFGLSTNNSKKRKKHIQINNKRRLEGFINASQKFLNDNFYYIFQIQYISNFIMNQLGKCSNSFEKKNIKSSY